MRASSHLLSVHFPCPQAHVESERQKIITAFRQLRQVLQEEKNFLLSRINWLDQEITKSKKFYVISTKSQLNSLGKLKDSLKARQCLPPGQLLQVRRIPWGPSCKKVTVHPQSQVRTLTTWQNTRVTPLLLPLAQCCAVEIQCEPHV